MLNWSNIVLYAVYNDLNIQIISNINVSLIVIGNHTVAIIKGKESYDLLKGSCSSVFNQVNDLVKTKQIMVNGINIPVEMYLGGDYKV